MGSHILKSEVDDVNATKDAMELDPGQASNDHRMAMLVAGYK